MISSNTNINKIRYNQNGLQDDLLTELADIYTTPLYVYDGDKILENFYAFQKAVSMLDCKIHFAVKANSSIAILYLLGKAGSGADIVSGGELQRALAANIKANDIIFSINKFRQNDTPKNEATVTSQSFHPRPWQP